MSYTKVRLMLLRDAEKLPLKQRINRFADKYTPFLLIEGSFVAVGVSFGCWKHDFHAGMFALNCLNAFYAFTMHCMVKHLKHVSRLYK